MLLFLGLLACGGSPSDSLLWREAWEVLISTTDSGVVDGRAAVGNTGLLRGQGHLNLDRWSTDESPMLYSIHGGPEDVDVSGTRDAVRIGSALIGRFETGENWTIRASSDAASAILHIDPGGPQPPIATGRIGDGQWTATAPITQGPVHGWYTAGKRGGLVEGLAIALHRGGDGRAEGPRRAAFAVSRDLTIGFDQQDAITLSWARVKDRDFPMEDARLSLSADGSARLDLRPSADLWIKFEPTGAGGQRDGLEHLLPPERLLAEASGHHAQRQVQRTSAVIHLEGKIIRSAGILLSVD
jgi:hypothetical protein